MNRQTIMVTITAFMANIGIAGATVNKPAAAYVAVEPQLLAVTQSLIDAKQLDLQPEISRNVAQTMLRDEVQIGISSNKWHDREVAQFVAKRGYPPTELFFTADVIAILANSNNGVDGVTIPELQQAFACHPSPQLPRWHNAKGAETTPMIPFAVDNQLIQHKRFSSWITCADGTYSATTYVSDIKTLLSEVASNRDAIAYTVYAEDIDQARTISVIDQLGDSYSINKETVFSGRYPLASVYYMYVDLPPNREYFNAQQESFIQLALSDEYQSILNQNGFISLPKVAIKRNRVRLKLDKPLIEGGYK